MVKQKQKTYTYEIYICAQENESVLITVASTLSTFSEFIPDKASP